MATNFYQKDSRSFQQWVQQEAKRSILQDYEVTDTQTGTHISARTQTDCYNPRHTLGLKIFTVWATANSSIFNQIRGSYTLLHFYFYFILFFFMGSFLILDYETLQLSLKNCFDNCCCVHTLYDTAFPYCSCIGIFNIILYTQNNSNWFAFN